MRRALRSESITHPGPGIALALAGALILGAGSSSGAGNTGVREPVNPSTTASLKAPHPGDDATALEKAFIDVAERVGPSVVSVEASYTVVQKFSPWGDEYFDEFFRHFFEAPQEMERQQPVRSMGSGVIVSADGYILTNAHVVGMARNITVRLLNKKEYKARLIGKDEGTDLAVLKIEPGKDIVPAPLGDSDQIRVGQWAIAIGNPFALENTVTVGVISAKGRQLDPSTGAAARYTSYIQTDASINRGNSGGPLLNLHGEVIGINTMIYSPNGGSIGIGFAIPSSTAKRILDGIMKDGRFVRPQMGIMYGPVKEAVAKKLGLEPGIGMEITSVLKGTAAEAAGIQPSDIMVAIDGKTLRQTEDLRNAILEHKVGDRIPVELVRKGKKMRLEVILREEQKPAEDVGGPQKKKAAGESAEIKWMGMTVIELTDRLAQELGTRNSSGVVVAQVEPGSAAEASGLQRGDIIREVEQEAVANITLFRSAIKKLKEKDGILLLTERQGSTMYLVLKQPEPETNE
jgi:Do/DeqQ family serine protease